MTEQKPGGKRPPEQAEVPTGPEADRELKPDAEPEALADFGVEHDTTTVSEDIATGRDEERESESPHGWAGLQS